MSRDGRVERRLREAWAVFRRVASACLLAVSAGCRQDMHDQPRYEPLEASDRFADGRASRAPVEGTVAQGHLEPDEAFRTGQVDGEPVGSFPLERMLERGRSRYGIEDLEGVLRRGRERYDIFCSPCHGRVGDGTGMVVQRGFRKPRSFHSRELRAMPPGYFFDAIANGFGAMPSYGARIPPWDRWAIVGYVRALQLSQHAPRSDVPREELAKLGALEE